MSIEVEGFDPRQATEDQLARLYPLWVRWDQDEIPGDPPLPFELYRLEVSAYPPSRYRRIWLLQDGGEEVGAAGVFADNDQNPQNAYGFLQVEPAHRGRGHARTLVSHVVDDLEAGGRSRFSLRLAKHFNGLGLAEAMGMNEVQRDRRSRLRIADVDWDLMDAWIERAAERASEYGVVFAGSHVPEEMVGQFVELMHVMNTAPRGDYEEDDEEFTVQAWRERERTVAEREGEVLNCIAVHQPTGEFAGFTNLGYQNLRPEQAWQWDTGVDPRHRNKGLGRWIKAANLRRAMKLYPKIERIDTNNATSNEAMLNINVEMGFRPIVEYVTYQGQVSAMREWVDAGRRRPADNQRASRPRPL